MCPRQLKHSSGEDGADCVQKTGYPAGSGAWERHIRLPRLDPLLDTIAPGFWVIKRRTASTRLRRTKKALWRWCRTNRHAPLTYQDQRRCLKLRGHFRYYGIRGNFRLLEEVLRIAEQAWRYWLSRRSSKSAIGWEQFQQLLKTYVLPTPKIVHHI
jgi:hypothetical protein